MGRVSSYKGENKQVKVYFSFASGIITCLSLIL